MKIGFVLDDSLDKPDGVQQYILTLGQMLKRHGHKVHYLVGETRRTDIANLHSLTKNFKVRFNRNRMTIPFPVNKKRLRALLDQEKFDVLHVQMPYSPMLAARVIREVGPATALVGTFHVSPYGQLANLGNRLLSIFLKQTQKRFDEFISVSSVAQNFAKKDFRIESQVIPNAIKLHRSRKLKENPEVFKIVFLGRLVTRKGCSQLFDAMKLLPETLRKNIELTIGGEGPLRRQLMSSAKRLHLRKPVNFVGFVAEQKKISFLKNADIAIFPSLGGESFGIVLLEAISAGCGVVLGGDNIGYRSVLGEFPACLVNVHNSRAFAEQLELVLRDQQLRSSIHNFQQKLVKRYEIDRVGQEVIMVYKRAIAKRRSSRDNENNEAKRNH